MSKPTFTARMRAGKGSGMAVAITLMGVVLVALVFVVGSMAGWFSGFNFTGGAHHTTTNQPGQQQITNVQSGLALKWEATISDAIAGGTVASPTVNSYTLSNCAGTTQAYCPTIESSTVTSGIWGPTTTTYAPGSILLYASASGYYPVYVVDSNPNAISCTSCAQPNTYYYLEAMKMIAAPASGTSATTNVADTIGGSGGNAAPSALSISSFSTFTGILNLQQASKGIASSYAVYGTSTQSVQVSSGTGLTQSFSGSISPVLVHIACMNQTSVQFSSGAGVAWTQMSGSGINTADSCYYTTDSSNLLGNALTSSSNPVSFSAPFQLEGTVSASAGHTAITLITIDNQLASGWIQTHFVTPAASSFPAAGAAAGVPTGFSGLTPTSYGVPSPLVEQSYTLIVVGH